MDYLIIFSYPHDWRGDMTLSFTSEDERLAYFEDYKAKRGDLGEYGKEGYERVRFATITEEVN